MDQNQWIEVKPIHCHQRKSENSLINKLRVCSKNKTELLLKFIPIELPFFFDHEIDHLPGMLEVCSLRQSALAVGHLVYDIPMDCMMVLDWIDVKLYCFSELNTATTAELELISIYKDKNKTEIVLEGLLIQENNVLMKMRGKMFAFSPKISNRIRHIKVARNEVLKMNNIEKHADNELIEIHAIINGNKIEEVKSKLFQLLKSKLCEKYELVPLYFTIDEEDFEIRICSIFNNPKLLGDFIVNKIRVLDGIQSTRVRLTLDGKIFQNGLKILSNIDNNYKSCHLFIKIDPSLDTVAWNSLTNLQENDSVYPTWCMRDFYDYNRDISLRIMGANKDSILEYIDKNVRTIAGVEISKTKFMQKIIKIQDDEFLQSFASKWISFES